MLSTRQRIVSYSDAPEGPQDYEITEEELYHALDLHKM